MTSFFRPLAALLLAATTAFSAHAQNLPEAIRFGGFGQGFGQPYGLALLAVAQGKGFIAEEFKGAPVKLSFEYLTGTGPAINEAIANDRLDFAQYGSLPNIIGKAGGLPTRIVASYGYTTVFALSRKDLDVKSFKDLKGRKVAVAKGTVLHWALLKALQDSGLTLRDIQLVDLKTADQLAALTAGSVDAAVGSSSLLTLRDKGVGKVFYSSKELGAKASGFGAITVTEGFEKRYPEATQRVANALVKSAHWLSQEANREEAYRIWALSGVPVQAFKDDFDGVALKDVFNPRVDAFLLSQYDDAIEFTKDNKLIRNDIDVAKWAAPAYVETALKAQGLENFWPRRNAIVARH
ncbi:ABC transporter substrate-binding protein [Hydrogenophaga sp. PBL-H3]|uniref:ABC transporter substrate-binding protein n=1 Tax=Hydrogenophaga sp. PBL-H3 TaxID=434010 RepID=UPI00131F950B|nr:ABC transporter substrate-binding protein [Hydrogenophaga sp. PBL-H3]QHE75816.1 transporter substrate-binding domain-containing protein [Hydrogenophaga sp. PBL-H3]QHE80241.1 transporter substrate-binding domain-containing protein [Hydrogenophaga sp. PBL-H3]